MRFLTGLWVLVRSLVTRTGYKLRTSQGVRYIGFRRMLMLDWDVTGTEGHIKEECCTVRSRAEAHALLAGWCRDNPGYRFVVYDTPGGVRAFLVSRGLGPRGLGALRVMSQVRCDPLYMKLARLQGLFWCRVSPKLSRANDYVARKVCDIGTGEVQSSLWGLVCEHDQLCGIAQGDCS